MQFPPFPHKQRVTQARPGAAKGAKRGEDDPLTARTGPYNPALRERGVEGPRCGGGAAFDPGFGFFNFISTGLAVLLLVLITICLLYVWSSRIVEESRGESSRIVEKPSRGVFPNSRGKLLRITQACGNRQFATLRRSCSGWHGRGSAQIGVEIQHKAWAVPSGLSRQPGPILRVSMKW